MNTRTNTLFKISYDASISSVNLAEVVAKMAEDGRNEDTIRATLRAFPLAIVPFDEALAMETGLLRRSTHRLGLSLGDRACLALAKHLGLPAYTTEGAWETSNVGAEVIVVR